MTDNWNPDKPGYLEPDPSITPPTPLRFNAKFHYDQASILMNEIVVLKDEPTFTSEAAQTLIQAAIAQSLMGLLADRLDYGG